MPPSTSGNVKKAVAAVVLLLTGVVCAGLYRVVSGAQQEVFASGAVPPTTVRVTVNKTYGLAVPGGVKAMIAHGVNQIAAQSGSAALGLDCEWSVDGSASQTLSVSAERVDTKAINTVGHFVAPVSGRLHIDCANWGTMFVPDAEDHSTDLAGAFLVATVLLLTIGAGVGLSALRSRGRDTRDGSGGPTSEDDEIQRLVHVVKVRSDDEEVGGSDGPDVLP